MLEGVSVKYSSSPWPRNHVRTATAQLALLLPFSFSVVITGVPEKEGTDNDGPTAVELDASDVVEDRAILTLVKMIPR